MRISPRSPWGFSPSHLWGSAQLSWLVSFKGHALEGAWDPGRRQVWVQPESCRLPALWTWPLWLSVSSLVWARWIRGSLRPLPVQKADNLQSRFITLFKFFWNTLPVLHPKQTQLLRHFRGILKPSGPIAPGTLRTVTEVPRRYSILVTLKKITEIFEIWQ